MLRLISPILFLAICSCSSTSEPKIVVKTRIEKVRVPEALLVPCPKKQRGRIVTTSDVVNRLIYTEGALAKCAAQIDGIRDQQAE